MLFDRDLLAKEAYYAVANPEEYLAQNDGSETDTEAIEKRAGQAMYGTPQLSEELDDIWHSTEELAIDQHQLAWQGAIGTARVLWDENYLYVLVNVEDSSIDTGSEFPWEQDSVEVFLEETFNQSSSYEEGTGQYRVNAEGEETFGEMTDNTSIESVVVESAAGYSVQVAIPWVDLSPESGDRIGFDLQINDAESGNRESVAVWNDLSGQAFQAPTVFGELELIRSEESGALSEMEGTDSNNTLPLVVAGLVVLVASVIVVIIYRLREKG